METQFPQGDVSATINRSAAQAIGSQDLGACCLACARQGHTCCQGHDIYVTRGDCERIRNANGAADFFEYRNCSVAAYAEQDDDPLWRQYVFRRDGSRRVLKSLADGNCLFLGPAGCSLALSARPLVCRLYPHLYSADGIAGVWDSECPATRTQVGAQLEQGIAGVQWSQAVQWHRMLYAEILWEVNSDENRPDV
jgi:Fe-S-cluster containining protein